MQNNTFVQFLPNLYRFFMTDFWLFSNLHLSLKNLANANNPKGFIMKNATIINMASLVFLMNNLIHKAKRKVTQEWETFAAHQYGGPF